jgi:capsular exopolysaccharide synthesis family protein
MLNNRTEGDPALNPEGYGYYPAGPPLDERPSGGLTPAVILRVLLMRWWLVLSGVAIAFGAAWYLIPQDQLSYRGNAVVSLDDERAYVSAGMVGDQVDPRSTEYMLSQIHIIRSESLVGDVVDQTGLRLWPSADLPFALLNNISVESDAAARDTLWLQFSRDGFVVKIRGVREIQGRYGEPVEAAGARFTIARAPGELSESFVAILPRLEAVARTIAGLNAGPRERTAILDIIYFDTDPVRAQVVVNAVAQAYQDYNTVGIQDRARLRREFLEEQLLTAQAELARNEEVQREFMSADRAFGSAERLAAERSTLLGLDNQRRQLEDERRVYQTFLDRLQGARDAEIDAELRTLMASPVAAASPLLSPLFAQLNGYQLDRAGKRAAGLSPTHPEVEQLETLIASARSSIAESTRLQVAALDQRIMAIDDQRDRSAITLQALPETSSDQIRLATNVESARTLVATLQAQYQSARLAESLEVSQVQVIDRARYATPVTVGNRQRALIVAIAFGFLFGGGGALLLEVTNTSVRGRGELVDLLALPALGVIPRIGAGSDGSAQPYLEATSNPASLNGRRAGAGGESKILVGAVAPAPPTVGSLSKSQLPAFHSMAAEAYRLLRTNLVFVAPDREIRTLVITSPSSGEGKTTTAANLAIAFARQGKRVLLVDADLRRPRLHTIFDVPQSPGFSELLLGRALLGEAIHPTAVERLSLLPRGRFDELAAEMLSGAVGEKIVAKIRERWDMVIFDTSPVLLTADATAVAPLADGVLLVVCAGKTSRDSARQAVQQLQVVGSPVLGFVLNDPKSVGDRYGEYKYSKQYYTAEV